MIKELKARAVRCARVHEAQPRVGPASYGSSMPAYLHEAGDYGRAERTVQINPATGKAIEVTLSPRVRYVPSSQDIADADRFMASVSHLSEATRALIWLYAKVMISKRRTFIAEARRQGITRQALMKRIDLAFHALERHVGSNSGLKQKPPVAIQGENTDKADMIGHRLWWRGDFTLTPEQVAPVDFSRFLKRA